MKFTKTTSLSLSVTILLSACAAAPMGPTVAVMPAPNKPLQMFQDDQASCKAFAQQQVAGQAEAANNKAVGTALLSTALGAGLGAAIGGGRGAGIGAASGAAVGTAAGADGSNNAQLTIQQQYNIAYSQCMYSKGNQVPGFTASASAAPPPPSALPPPPPGAPPPPR